MRHILFLIWALLCLNFSAIAQQESKSNTEKAARTALTQTIRGTVKDNESQTPLIGASVVIVGTEPLKGSSTDVDGNFRIEGVPVGRHTIKISSVGYEDRVISEMLVGSGKEVVLTIGLTESLIQMEEVVISAAEQEKGKPINEMVTLSARSISVEETKRYAASVNDPARAALSFAGVVSTNDSNNEIVIRGNSPRGMLWRLEGIEIPNPNHFAQEGASGGGVSILSVNMLDNSDFLTGAFPAEYGNALSGVFDVKLRKGNNEKREYAFQAGVLGVDFAAEGPFSAGSKGSYLINYRYSTLAILNKIGIKIAGDAAPDFQDLSFKFHFPTKKAGSFAVWGIGGLSRQKTDAIADSTKWDSRYDSYSDDFSARMGAIGFSHTFFLDNRTYLESVLSLSGNDFSYKNDTLNPQYQSIPNFSEAFEYTGLRASVLFNRKFNARSTFRTGIIVSRLGFNLFSEGRQQDNREQFIRYINNSGNTYISQAYAQWKYRIAQNFTLNTGFHFLYLGLNRSNSLEPRVGLTWDFAPTQSVAAGFGIHSRHEAMSTYFAQQPLPDGTYSYPNKNLGFTKAKHWVLSYNNQLREDLRFKSEVYYQQLYNVPISPDPANTFATLNFRDGFTTDSLVNKGKGRNYGVELTLEKFFTNNYYFLATTSLYNSKYTAANGVEYNTRFNGNFITNLTAGKEFKVGRNKNNLIGANIKWLWAGGNRFTPINLEASKQKGEAVYYREKSFEAQVPDYYRLDVRLSYRKNRPKASYILSLDIQNATNHLNVFNQYYDKDKQSIETIYQMGLIPVLNYRIEF